MSKYLNDCLKLSCGSHISETKWRTSETWLLQTTNRKLYMTCKVAPCSITSSDQQGDFRPPAASKNRFILDCLCHRRDQFWVVMATAFSCRHFS